MTGTGSSANTGNVASRDEKDMTAEELSPAAGQEPARSLPERRSCERYPVEWAVDCVAKDTFLYAAITNISQLGIFVASREPFEEGTDLSLKFQTSEDEEPFVLPGRVQWVNRHRPLAPCRNPGMGVQFLDLGPEDRERLVELVHTIAYVRDLSN